MISATHISASEKPDREPVAVICSALIALPFVLPAVAGPSVNVWQQLISWLCVALLLIFAKPVSASVNLAVLAWLAMVAFFIVVFRGMGIGANSILGAAVAILAVGMAADIGAAFFRGTERMNAAFAYGLLGAGIVSAVLGLAQYYGFAKHLEPWTTAPAIGQAFGNLRQRNQFASLIAMALISALWLYATLKGDGRSKRIGWLATVVLLVIAAAASTSRTGLIEFLLIIGSAAWMARRERLDKRHDTGPDIAFRLPPPRKLLLLIPLYFVAAWALPQFIGGGAVSVMQRLNQNVPVGHSRLALWSNVLTLVSEHPWAGWGWGELSFAHYTHSALYPGPRFVEILDNAHNLPLHLSVELGIPAAVAICGGFLWLVITAQPWRERQPFRIMAWGVLGVIVLHSLLEYPLWYGPFQLVFGLSLGILWPSKGGLSTPGRISRLLPTLFAAALGLVVAYAGWDYIRVSQIYLPRDQRLPPYEDNTLAKLQGSWLFENQVRFAELTLTQVDRGNASEVHALAAQVLHFSPEPRVIVRRIESAALLGLADEARSEAVRFSIAFPVDYAKWVAGERSEGKEIDSRQP
jgi:O-antigen ligase